MSQLTDGTMFRQLLPYDLAACAAKVEVRKQYRWVAWSAEPITYHWAEVHLDTGGPAACVVIVFRGPQGGWTDARFVRRHDKLPKPRVKAVRISTSWSNVERTYYYGWVQERVAQIVPLKSMDLQKWRAHLTLHA